MGDLGVRIAADESAHSAEDAKKRIEMGYTAISPFQQCSTEKDPKLAAERIQTLTVCLGALAAVVMLMIFLLGKCFPEKKD